MSKQRILLLVVLLLVILAFALFLWQGTETAFGDWVFDNGFRPPILFFIFFGALAGVMKLLVDAALPKRMPTTERIEWEGTRRSGRKSFILTALLISGIPIIIFFPVQGLVEGVSGEVMRNYIVVTVVLLGGIVAIANAMWKYKESAYSNSEEIETKR